MDVMQLRRNLLMQETGSKKIGGIDVYLDNARYPGGNAKIDSVTTDNEYFLAGIFDTGTTSRKSYTISYTKNTVDNAANIRFYNDITANSVDYWGVGTGQHNLPSTRTFTSAGRYIVTTIYKELAADMYLYDNTNQRYVFKGKNVT